MISFHTGKNTLTQVSSPGIYSFRRYFQKRVSIFSVGSGQNIKTTTPIFPHFSVHAQENYLPGKDPTTWGTKALTPNTGRY